MYIFIPGRFCKYKLKGIGMILRLYMGSRLADVIRTHINKLSVVKILCNSKENRINYLNMTDKE